MATTGRTPSVAIPAADVTPCASAMPTSKWRCGNALSKMSVLVPLGIAAVMATTRGSSAARSVRPLPNTF